MPDPFGISVVVVNWNARDELVRCLESLTAQTDSDFETIVVDNGSEDDSVSVVRQRFPKVRLIEAGENLGFAEGCNRGIEASQRAWVATLNNDATAVPDWIARLRATAREGGERLGMIQSRMVFRERPDRTNSTGVVIFDDGAFSDRDFDRELSADDGVVEVFCVSAGAAMYRRAMLDEVRLASGFFDRSFFMYFEDVDLGWRCRLAGYSALYAPSAKVEHAFRASSSRQGSDFMALHCARNRVRTLSKNASSSYFVRSMPRMMKDLVWFVRRRGFSTLRDYAQALRDGLGQRSRVTRLARVSRTELERRWITTRRPAG